VAWLVDTSGSKEILPKSDNCSEVPAFQSDIFLLIDKAVSPKKSRLVRLSIMQESR
jgi:hypothetical protein